MEKVYEVTRGKVTASYRGERHYTRPWGLFGGLAASPSRAFFIRNGKEEEIPSKQTFSLEKGDQIHVFLSGGGGYGDPLDRKPEMVLRDVLDRRVSLKSAREDYGIVVNGKSMTLDLEMTSRLRQERKKLRGPVTWRYDRGPGLGKE